MRHYTVPEQIASAVLISDYKAEDFVTGTVAGEVAWPDRLGRADFLHDSRITPPTLTASHFPSGLDAVTFSGSVGLITADMADPLNLIAGGKSTVVIILEPTAPIGTADYIIYAPAASYASGADGRYALRINDNSISGNQIIETDVAQYNPGSTGSYVGSQVMVFQYDQDRSDTADFYQRSTLLGSTSITPSSNAFQGNTPIMLGCGAFSPSVIFGSLSGHVGRILIYDDTFAPEEFQTLISLLNIQYGIGTGVEAVCYGQNQSYPVPNLGVSTTSSPEILGFYDNLTTPTVIKARVENQAAAVIQDWTVLDASPSGGLFSGTIAGIPVTLDGGANEDYTIKLRADDDAGSEWTMPHTIRVGANGLLDGQSDEAFFWSGARQNGNAPALNPNTTFTSHAFHTVSSDIALKPGYTSTYNGNGGRELGDSLPTTFGHSVSITLIARASSTLEERLPDVELPTNNPDLYAAHIERILDFAFPFNFIKTTEGESEFIGFPNDGGLATERALDNYVAGDFASARPFYQSTVGGDFVADGVKWFISPVPWNLLAPIQYPPLTAEQTFDNRDTVLNLQIGEVLSNSNVYQASEQYPYPYADQFHLTADGYLARAESDGPTIAAAYGKAARDGIGPRISDVDRVDDVLTITLTNDEDAVADVFTQNTAGTLTDYHVYDPVGDAFLTYSSIVFDGTNVVTITLDAIPSNDVGVAFMTRGKENDDLPLNLVYLVDDLGYPMQTTQGVGFSSNRRQQVASSTKYTATGNWTIVEDALGEASDGTYTIIHYGGPTVGIITAPTEPDKLDNGVDFLKRLTTGKLDTAKYEISGTQRIWIKSTGADQSVGVVLAE